MITTENRPLAGKTQHRDFIIGTPFSDSPASPEGDHIGTNCEFSLEFYFLKQQGEYPPVLVCSGPVTFRERCKVLPLACSALKKISIVSFQSDVALW